MVFFTTPELMEIGGLPFVSPNDKPTRLEALRYYRRGADTYKLDIAFDETVTAIRRSGAGTVVHDRRRQHERGGRRRSEAARSCWRPVPTTSPT